MGNSHLCLGTVMRYEAICKREKNSGKEKKKENEMKIEQSLWTEVLRVINMPRWMQQENVEIGRESMSPLFHKEDP